MADYKGENAIFKKQQQQAFQGVNQQADLYNQMTRGFTDMLGERFGRQSQVFDALSGSLMDTLGRGAGNIGSKFWENPGYLPSDQQIQSAAQSTAGRNLSPQELQQFKQAVADYKRQQGDEAGARAVESGAKDPFEEMKIMSGYDPSIYQFQPRRFQAKEQAALRTQMAEEAANAYGDSAAAFGLRAQQLGGYGPGLEAAALRDMESQNAASQAEGQRQAILFGAQNLREDMRAGIPLRVAQGEALAREAQMQNQIAMQKAQMQAAQQAQSRAIAAQRRAAGAAARQSAQQFSQAQRLQASQFASEMDLKRAQFESENYFRSIGALSGLAGMMDPNVYGQLGLQGLGGAMGGYGNVYNTGSQGMVQTRSNPLWGQLLSGAIGGGLSFATGGMSGLGGLFGGGRGGGGNMGAWESAAYNNGNPSFYGPGY